MARTPRLARPYRLNAEMDLCRIEIVFPPHHPPYTRVIGRLASGKLDMDQSTEMVLKTHVLTQRGKDFLDELIALVSGGNAKEG